VLRTPQKRGNSTIAVVGGIAQRGAPSRFAASGALHRGAVDQQQIIHGTWALAGEDTHQPLQRLGQAATALEVPGLLGHTREQMRQALGRHGQKAPVRRDAHDRLRHTQRDDLRACDASGRVVLPLGQEIVGGAEHRREQQVEVGVHPGPHGSAMPDRTADFDPAALKSTTNTAHAVESLI
jgi:hypothetical protein